MSNLVAVSNPKVVQAAHSNRCQLLLRATPSSGDGGRGRSTLAGAATEGLRGRRPAHHFHYVESDICLIALINIITYIIK